MDVQEESQYQNPLKNANADIIIKRFQDAVIDEVAELKPGQS